MKVQYLKKHIKKKVTVPQRQNFTVCKRADCVEWNNYPTLLYSYIFTVINIDVFKLLEIVNVKLGLGGYKSIQGRESVEMSSGQVLSEITWNNGVFPKWSRTFIEFSDFSEFRESDKSLKHELDSI